MRMTRLVPLRCLCGADATSGSRLCRKCRARRRWLRRKSRHDGI